MFNKDLLLIDMETTGLEQKRHEIIQLAAVLLDRKSLNIKKQFVSYIRPKKWKTRDPKAMAINKIELQMLKNAPALEKVITDFKKKFPKNLIIAYYGGPLDMDFLRSAFKQSKYSFSYDYHFFNLWPVFYTFFALQGKLTNKKRFTGFTLEDAMAHFGITSSSRHDALEDCKIEAKLLKFIIKALA